MTQVSLGTALELWDRVFLYSTGISVIIKLGVIL